MKAIIYITILTTILSAKIFQDFPTVTNRITPNSKYEILSYYDRLKDIKKAVVNIATTKRVPVAITLEEYMLSQIYGFTPRYRTKKKTYALGSGVIVTKSGYIITNQHVIAGAEDIYVTLEDSQKTYKAMLIGSDKATDIAVIKIAGKNLPYAKFANSKNLRVGDLVFAIGNPFGIGESVSMGIVSALNKTKVGINRYENFIQTDASINPGNSGGALVDSRGALIGINSAIYSKSGGNNGVGFTIPSNMVKTIALKLIKYGKIRRGLLGISVSDLTDEYKQFYRRKHGIVIVDTQAGFPAYNSGLKRGDLIVKINGDDIKDISDFENKMALYQVGDTISVTFERDGLLYQVDTTLIDPNKIYYIE
jgi:serine protease Do